MHSRPRFVLKFAGVHATRPEETITGEDFIAVKSFRAKGKRLSSWEIGKITEIEPEMPTPNDESDGDIDGDIANDIAGNDNNNDSGYTDKSDVGENNTKDLPDADIIIDGEQMELF